ncbi:MAG TPA: bifunctional UDP-sugar hydrolase/5'-nucleotidase [Methanocorpusculum sp.]|nr:bifunctional UDP-sugar hydrolase/5'-nucleotidase [Methanocorpusculum sp.]
MNGTKKAVIFAALTAVILFCFIAGCVDTNNASDENLYIIHTNDVHGHFADNLGYTSVAALYQQMKGEGKHVILVDAGDFSQGTVELKATDGEAGLDLMNMVGYQVAIPGNHEFDYGFAHLLSLKSKMNFSFISANIFYNNTDQLVFPPNTIIEAGTHKVGIFGLTTPETAVTTFYTNVEDVDFASGDDLYKIAQDQVDYLKSQGCDLIICIGHLGVCESSDPNRSTDVAKNVDGIDLLVDGHSHTVMEGGEIAGSTLVVQTGSSLQYIGLVTVSPDGKITETLISESPGHVDKVDAYVADIMALTHEVYGEIVATTSVELVADKVVSRTGETNLGDLSTDSMMYAAEAGGIKADFAVINGGAIRNSIHVGDVTEYDLLNVFPFGNKIVAADMSGRIVAQMIEDQTQVLPEPKGGFPQVSGMSYTVDTTRPYAAGEVNRVTIDLIQGRSFDLNATYTVILTDFLVNGGDSYPNIPAMGGTYITLHAGLEDGLIYYISDKLNGLVDEEYAKPKGRITIITNESVSAASIPKATLIPGAAA